MNGAVYTAIIQARMGSTRLPGKVLLPILGRPMLHYQIERIHRCPGVDRIVVATTTAPYDDTVEIWCANNRILCHRCPEDNVLERYVQAARRFHAERIVRLTGDCPLLDPVVCGRIIASHAAAGVDYARTGQSFAEGLDCEVLTTEALERAHREARLPSQREHLTMYIVENPNRFSLLTVENEMDEGRYRITVDEPADFEVVSRIFEALYPQRGPDFGFFQIRCYLDAHPEIMALNSTIIRNEGYLKSLDQSRE